MMNEPFELEPELKTVWLGRHLEHFPSLSSTGTLCCQLAEKGAPTGTVVVADTQTAGRGRNGSHWESPEGGLWFSLLLRPDCPPAKAAALTAVTAVGLCRGLLYYPGLGARIKWPNDLFADGKKFGGILSEMKVEEGKVAYAVIGVGIDISSAGLSENLRAAACGMEDVFGDVVDRKELLCRLLLGLESAYDQFFGGREDLVFEEWKEHALFVGETVTAETVSGAVRGKVLGLSGEGFLLLDLGSGKGAKIISGRLLTEE
ncbi:MAG: biotin--[acetyl-CoA-carboxylase] ligase [Bacillota bacterium]|jgi:BirA family biotin operon repressor/biotin-[acetyl-CoA-carboxylase] ligase